MAVSGDTFCTSAWNGFLINLKHCVKFYFAQEIGGFFIFIGVVFITAINTLIFWGLVHIGNTGNVSYIIPLIVIAVFSFIVCQITLGLFNDAIRATLMSLAVDMDLNNGTPKFGPPTFHEKLSEIFDDSFAKNFNNVDDGVSAPLVANQVQAAPMNDSYNNQQPPQPYQQQQPPYGQPGYGAPQPGYGAQQPGYGAPQPDY